MYRLLFSRPQPHLFKSLQLAHRSRRDACHLVYIHLHHFRARALARVLHVDGHIHRATQLHGALFQSQIGDAALRVTQAVAERVERRPALDSGASPRDVQGQMRHTDARMSLYYGKVIPASVKKEVNKLVDQMKTKIEEQAKKLEQAEAKPGESDEISAQNRPPEPFGRRLLHAEVLERKWWARQDSNL